MKRNIEDVCRLRKKSTIEDGKELVYACYIVYNSAKTLALSLRSIVPYVDKVIIVDGAFANYPHKYPQSTDGTKSIANRICKNKLIWIDCPKTRKRTFKPWAGQVAKRNAYLDLVPHGTFFYILDADTVVTGNVEGAMDYLRRTSWRGCMKVREINFFPIRKVGEIKQRQLPLFQRWLWDELVAGYKPTEREWFEQIYWIGNYNYVSSVYRKHKDMKYKKRHSTIYVPDEEGNDVLACKPSRDWTPILRGIVEINMKFLCTNKEYLDSFLFKLKRIERIKKFGREL